MVAAIASSQPSVTTGLSVSDRNSAVDWSIPGGTPFPGCPAFYQPVFPADV